MPYNEDAIPEFELVAAINYGEWYELKFAGMIYNRTLVVDHTNRRMYLQLSAGLCDCDRCFEFVRKADKEGWWILYDGRMSYPSWVKLDYTCVATFDKLKELRLPPNFTLESVNPAKENPYKGHPYRT